MKRIILIWMAGFLVCASCAFAEEYLLGPEDVLDVSVWKDDAMTRKVIVRPDGYISFPLIGDIEASGKSIEQLRKTMQEKISEFIPDAPVSVVLEQVGNTKVYVVGKVNRPGMYIMGHEMTVTQALALAGGLNTFADGNSIHVLRMDNGKQQAIEFSYDKISSGKNLETNIILKPHDTIVVP